jgi:hypothetical protein
VKGKQIKASTTASPLETCNNHQKMVGTLKKLLEYENRIAGKRDTNTISNTVVSQKEKQ